MYTFDHYAKYSNDLSQIYFGDFKNEMNNQSLWLGDRQTDYLVIFESEALKNAPYYKKSVLSKMRKSELFELCEMFELIGYWQDEKDLLKAELIDDLLTVDNERFYNYHYSENTWRDLECDFIVQGYSQGDVIKVLLIGNVEKYINEDYLQNIFFNSPINGRVTVYKDGEFLEDINFYELNNFNEYDYFDKDKLIEMMKDHCKNDDYCTKLIEYLENSLPDQLGYDY